MPKINYQLKMDEQIARIPEGTKPRLLLHACCAPCSSAVLEVLRAHFDITMFFYNPNIYPESEFQYRLKELKRLLPALGLADVDTVAPPYVYAEFEAIAEGLENAPEGGARCKRCYRLRQEAAAKYAAENGFDYVTTTLSISPHKNAAWLNEIGEELAGIYGVPYLYGDFKKRDGYKRSLELSREFDLYRQDYCGCVYSKRQREEEKNR